MSDLTDLIHNYFNERIAELCYEKKFTEPLELYAREHVEVEVQAPHLRPHYVTRMIDQKQQLVSFDYPFIYNELFMGSSMFKP